jgi:hypothetical protein
MKPHMVALQGADHSNFVGTTTHHLMLSTDNMEDVPGEATRIMIYLPGRAHDRTKPHIAGPKLCTSRLKSCQWKMKYPPKSNTMPPPNSYVEALQYCLTKQ